METEEEPRFMVRTNSISESRGQGVRKISGNGNPKDLFPWSVVWIRCCSELSEWLVQQQVQRLSVHAYAAVVFALASIMRMYWTLTLSQAL